MKAQQVLVGVIGKALGVRGEVWVRVHTDFPQLRFAKGQKLNLRGAANPTQPAASTGEHELVVRTFRKHSGAMVVSFTGIADRNTAQALQGGELWVELTDFTDLAVADEFHDLQLIGLDAVDDSHTLLGSVERVEHLLAQDILIVATPSGERMVPFVKFLVPEVNLAQGYVMINPIPGLLSDVEM
ncbi:MAG: ribosome maturation factor RimM [Propionibacteriaceae bacterium]|nr:ribosome maturation factor RimM [Propionibacteriaceae bacterium]